MNFIVIRARTNHRHRQLRSPPFVFRGRHMLTNEHFKTNSPNRIRHVTGFIIAPFATGHRGLVGHHRQRHMFTISHVTFKDCQTTITEIFILSFLAMMFRFTNTMVPAPVVTSKMILTFRTIFIRQIKVAVLAIRAMSNDGVIVLVQYPNGFSVTITTKRSFGAQHFSNVNNH